FEEFTRQIFDPHPLGRPIIGTEASVSSFTRDDLFGYMRDQYAPGNLIVSVAGNTTHEQVVDRVNAVFDRYWEGSARTDASVFPEYAVSHRTLTKAIEQTHLVMGRRALSNDDPRRYALLLANTVLGGGMSSRLHQNIREKYCYC